MGREGAGVVTDKAGSTQGQAMRSLVDLIKDLSILGTMGVKQGTTSCVCACVLF